MGTLEQLALQALAREPLRPCIEYENRWFTWGEMRHVAERLGALIDASGAPPAAPVAFVARNRPSAVAALLGLISKGCSVRMVYAFQSASAMARDVERLSPSVIVGAPDDFTGEMVAVLRAGGVAAVAVSDMDAVAVLGLERCVGGGLGAPAGTGAAAKALAAAPMAAARGTDLAAAATALTPAPAPAPRLEILTSGTTGPPKHFALSFEVIARHHVGVNFLAPGQGGDVLAMPPMLLFFPLGSISGIYSTLPTLLRGRRAELWDRFTVAAWHRHVLLYRPELTGVPPAGVQMVLDANIPSEDLASIRLLSTGAAPLDPTVQRAFEERYGIPILLSYGATEFGGPVAAMTPDLYPEWGKRKFGSVGRALPGAQLRVVDPDTGAVLPAGKEGLLEVVSPRLGPSWIRTSDIAFLDEDGFLFHRGRADGAIMRGGFKLLPETIERALLLHPSVSAASVVGIPDNRLGQVPAAAIQVKPGAGTLSAAELEAHLRTHILRTHIPVKWRFVQELPKNPSLKTDRPAVLRLFMV